MTSIDERVVSMVFDNKQFEDGIKTSMGSLDSLNKSLKMEGATKGLTEVSEAAKGVNLGIIASGVDTIAGKFKDLSIVGITALTNLATKAVDAGIRFVKALTLEPILQGMDVYETKINAIQTILANTANAGTNLKQVTDALNILNQYANQTVFSFADMAKNIGTFTAAGVGLQTSVDSIKGIANLAALSGSSAEQASGAMYQLSQAIAAGSVKLQDWNSVVNAGIGGKVFQKALIDTARAHGVAVDAMIKKDGSFRESLQEGWITSSILTDTLAQFTGDLSDAQLKAMGFTEQEAQGILKMGKAAVDAAVQIRTVTQLQAALREEVGTAWAAVWETLVGNITDATKLLTNVHNVMENAFTKPVYALNTLLQGWADLGGRDLAIKAITNALKDVGAILKPIKEAWADVFPAATAQQLFNITKAIESLTEKLKIGADTSDELHRTFAGLFSVLGIGWDLLKEVVKTLVGLLGVTTEGTGGILKFTASVGDFLVNLREAEQRGEGFVNFFDALGRVIAVPINLIKTIASAILTMFGNFDSDKATAGVTEFASKLDLITTILDAIASGGDKLNEMIAKVADHLQPVMLDIVHFLSGVGPAIAEAVSKVDWSSVLATVNTGLFAGFLVILKQFIDKFKKASDGESGLKGLIGAVQEPFEAMTKTLSTMQNTLRAATLLEIAAAIGLLTISAVALSNIDSDGLTRALTAMTVMFTQLFASMAIFQRIGGSSGFAKMPLVTGAMILLATAVDILTIAVKQLSELSWEDLSKGLSAVSILIGDLVGAVNLMPDEGKMISGSLGMLAIAGAVKILVGAVTDLSGLSWEEIGKGLTGVAGILTALALYTKFADADAGGVLAGAGIVLLATGIRILTTAVMDMSKMSWEEIGKGLTTLAGALTIIAIALDAIPPTAPLSAAGVLIVAISLGKVADALDQMGKMSWGEILKGLTAMLGALTLITAALYVIPPTAILGAAGLLVAADALGPITDALERMGKMSWGEIGKSMTELFGALTILALGLTAMIAALPGAAAMLIVAAALAILFPILKGMGDLSWEEIGKGLLTLAGVFVILGAAGVVLTPVVPTLLALGVAIALIGAGTLAAGIGVLALSVGLTALSIAGTAGATAIALIFSTILSLIPMAMAALAQGILDFASVIATGGPQITAALTTVLLSLVEAIVTIIPAIQGMLAKLLLGMLELLEANVPKMVDAGLKLLIGILNGIANNIGKVIGSATDVAVNFINGIGAALPRITDAGVKLVISFVNGLADAIRNNTEAMHQAGVNLATAIIDGMTGGLSSGVSKVTQEAKNVAKSALDAAKKLLGINSPSKAFEEIGKFSTQGLANGFSKYSNLSTRAAEDLADDSLKAMKTALLSITKVVPNGLDLQPTITPVMDLTGVYKGSDQINKILAGTVPLSASVTNVQAQDAAAGIVQNQDDLVSVGASPKTGDTIYNQTINSPKPISTAEVYRQTKNQLSKVKGDVEP